MSLRLSATLRTSPEFWLKIRIQHDLWQAQQKKQPNIQPFRRAGLLASSQRLQGTSRNGRTVRGIVEEEEGANRDLP
jgi:hypothetical protein